MADKVEVELNRLRNRVAQLTREAERLKLELDRVQDEHGKIDYALSVLERVTGADTGTDSDHEPAVQPDRPKPLRRRSRGTYDQAVRTINSSTRTWRVEELVRQMREDGWDVEVKNEVETVRAALSRAVSAGEVTRTSYGVYGAKRGTSEEGSPSDAVLPGDDEPQPAGRDGQDLHTSGSYPNGSYAYGTNVEPVSS
jgi:hypothetical protein